ncbi:MAG: sigma-54 dependent transcriptional regulator [Bacillota bacterium]
MLIQGETGTGKEVFARYIHKVSHRSDRPFLGFNCGAFTETLLESELFGHEKGSFTGATSKKKGIFELAHKGTLFLDEIDSASPAIQIKLLRILETGEFQRVGGEELCKVDVRIITATNTNLAARVEEEKFREDLFYRLDVASLYIPPLRERAEDIPLFVDFFLEKETADKEASAKKFSDEALDLIKKHSWPGNIRELANTVAQAVLLSKGPMITMDDLPARIKPVVDQSPELPPGERGAPLFDTHPAAARLRALLDEFEALLMEKLTVKKGFGFCRLQDDLKVWYNRVAGRIIELALEATFGNQVQAARLLGITPRALRYYMEKAKPEERQSKC